MQPVQVIQFIFIDQDWMFKTCQSWVWNVDEPFHMRRLLEEYIENWFLQELSQLLSLPLLYENQICQNLPSII